MIRLEKAAGYAQSLTAEMVEDIARREAVAAFAAAGTCLEGQGVRGGDVLCVSFQRMPKRGDLCLCRLDGHRNAYPVFKKYLHREQSGAHAVATSHADAEKNQTFHAGRIYGTVVAQIRDGKTLWALPILDKPTNDPPRFTRMERDGWTLRKGGEIA